MSLVFRLPASALLLMTTVAVGSATGQALAANPTAAQSVTKACGQQYQSAKAAGTLNGKTWKQFLSDCSASMKSDTSATAAAAPAKADTKTKPKVAAAAPAKGDHMTTQQICSQQYQAAKTGGTLNGQKWPQFLKACSDSIKSDQEDAGASPPEPAAATKAAAQTVPTTDSKGKALTPGQIAFRQRIHECSVEWQADKAAGTIPNGQKWPQFWSACNTRLKAQG